MTATPSHLPAESLTNRSFVGLITAQFLAGFADQAIHASAMFYAIRTDTLSEANAIALMPILFFAPWAIFCTLAGYFADRYSKTFTLRFWKISEIAISLIMIVGFYIGSYTPYPAVGGWTVLSCVFMIGTHAAFFGPAKYGAMPEILRPHILSRGNGILESTTFLANIFGTVSGGLLMYIFHKNELWIGVVLLGLSVVGVIASYMIDWLPAGNPERRFPWTNPFQPLVVNLQSILRSRPLALSLLGIAFFVFMVAYMRASMYMHGETRNPHWTELKTSLIVATVALGVGLGSPLAGYLSGGKIELGLVPIGCLGITLGTLIAAAAIEHEAVLIVALIIIGFFSGFYMVPLYTLLQHRAPKASKGEVVSSSNFINVTGAIIASLLFNVLVQASRFSGVTPEIPAIDKVVVGVLEDVNHHEISKKIVEISIKKDDGEVVTFRAKSLPSDFWEDFGLELGLETEIRFEDDTFDVLHGAPQVGDKVVVSKFTRAGVEHYAIRKEGQELRKIYDNEILPRYLFFGASFMTLAILFLLCRKLPDFFVRSLFWYKTLGRFRLKAVSMSHLPTEGPVILATNCHDLESCLQLVSATDRTTKVVLVENIDVAHDGVLLRALALRSNLILVRSRDDVDAAWHQAADTLRDGHLLAVGVMHEEHAGTLAPLLEKLRQETGAPILPVYCGSIEDGAAPGMSPRVRVVFGDLMTQQRPSAEQALEDCKAAITALGTWIRQNDESAGSDH